MAVDGEYVVYTIQHRTTHKSPWGRPDGTLSAVRELRDWCLSSWDVFGASLSPRAKCPAASADAHSTWATTGYHGWTALPFARRALRRVRRDDAKGRYDAKDGYRKVLQAARHEFRIVKITLAKKTEVCDHAPE